jgi:hydrogenase nickel incorporation protein HypB
MHEAMVAQSILAAISSEAAKRPGRPIGAKISCGKLYTINDETLCFAFEALAKGTPCEDVKIEVEHKPIQGQCRKCRQEFNVEDSSTCRKCGSEDFELLPDALLTEKKKPCLNMISSPGSGKTTILARTIRDMKGRTRIGVIEGDIKTDIDAEKIRAAEAPAVQINTNGACHLSAAQVNGALQELPMGDLDLIFIENVGNLVCPSAFELGETAKVVVLSVAEGDDKPAKYPAIFAKSKVLLINKIDLLEPSGRVDFDMERAEADARKLNRSIEIFPVSAKTGEGMAAWYGWIEKLTRSLSQDLTPGR